MFFGTLNERKEALCKQLYRVSLNKEETGVGFDVLFLFVWFFYIECLFILAVLKSTTILPESSGGGSHNTYFTEDLQEFPLRMA